VVYSFKNSNTVALSSGTPTVRIYISDGSDGAPQGTLKVRNSEAAGVSCSGGCAVENGQTSFPGMSIPLAQWMAGASGVWDTGGTDLQAFLSTKPSLTAGPGISVAQGASDNVSIDTTLVPKKYAGAGPPGNLPGSLRGDLYVDTANFDAYLCFAAGPCTAVGVGNWRKLALQ
jgi:hypothetical protein